MAAKLQILIEREARPHPDDPKRLQVETNIVPRWVVNGQPQECTDRALVIAALTDALQASVDSVPFTPPGIIRPQLELAPGRH